ncbi:MAG: protein regulator of cytokinesis family protein [Clostridia bacterium]|nr:protein regulator of cytokinesis family protein [Clostridia bacterium]
MSQIEIIAFIAQTALTYIFINVATGNAQKQTVTDSKTDLRTTKEDLLAELKDSRETLLRESEVSTTATIDVLKAELQKLNELLQASKNDK